MAKKFISAAYKSKKITLPDETVNFCTKEVIFRDLRVASRNEIFSHGQNTLSQTKNICPGQI